jgi:hypothetical protein
MPKNKNIFKQVWEWLLDMGLVNATLLLNSIHLVLYILLMWLVKWIDKHY